MTWPSPPQIRGGEASHILISLLQTKRVWLNDRPDRRIDQVDRASWPPLAMRAANTDLEAERGDFVEGLEWEGSQHAPELGRIQS